MLSVCLLAFAFKGCAETQGGDIDIWNEELQTAAADALMMSNNTAGFARCRYLTMIAIPPEERVEAAQAISALCHQLSHAGYTILPSRVSDTLLRLQLELYDPFDVGWRVGWERVVPLGHVYHVDFADGEIAVDYTTAEC